MRELISHSDFHYFAEINEKDFINVQKLRKIPYDIFNIIISVVVLVLLIFLNRVFVIHFVTNSLVISNCITIILVRSFHLCYCGHICGLSYGVVTDKQSQSKIINTYAKYEIYPWGEDVYTYGQDKPFRAYIKDYYYVNASICDTNQYLEHICCYEKNYDRIKIGDKVIIVKFKDGNIVAIPMYVC